MSSVILGDKTKKGSSLASTKAFTFYPSRAVTSVVGVAPSYFLFEEARGLYQPIQSHSSMHFLSSNEVEIVHYPRVNFTSLSSKIALNIKKVNSYNNLIEDWNGYGGASIPRIVIEHALAALPNLNRQPHVSPTSRGTIQFDYENGDNFLEAEIYGDHISVFQSKNEIEREFDTDIFQLARHINNFYAP